MKKYHKIQTIYKRDPETKFSTLLMGEYSTDEIALLANCRWVLTEKLDGTNIRVMVKDGKVSFGGKTDRAQIPAKLVEHLRETFDNEEFIQKFDDEACLYGEGCGAGIQKGGGNYYPDQRFVLFDVKVGDWWLTRKTVGQIARDLNLPVAPIVGSGTLGKMVDMCRRGFKSEWGDFRAEGIVARPAVELFGRNGDRIITKLKCKDFQP
jgi:ATP-dependent RNA circularization protein (DNA/RNA ligase family)